MKTLSTAPRLALRMLAHHQQRADGVAAGRAGEEEVEKHADQRDSQRPEVAYLGSLHAEKDAPAVDPAKHAEPDAADAGGQPWQRRGAEQAADAGSGGEIGDHPCQQGAGNRRLQHQQQQPQRRRPPQPQ